MAVSGLDDGVQKHQKVYSFLKRNLPQDRYEGIRVIEPCVIVAEGFKKPFMFAVLGDEMLYITENPPRASKDIKIQVDLAHVTSVELIHDVAEFLGGDLKTKNQHILVIYKKAPKQSLSSHSTSVAGGDSRSASKLALLASVVSATSPVLKLETVEGNGACTVLRPSSLVETGERQPNASQYLKVQTSKMHLSASDSDLRNIKHKYEKAFYTGPSSLVTHQTSHRPLPPPPPGCEALVKKSNSNYRVRSASVSMDRKMPSSHHRERKGTGQDWDLNSSSSSSEHEISCYQTSLHVFHRQKSADASYRYGATASDQDLLEKRRMHHRKSSNESTGSHGEVFLDSDNDHIDANDDNFSVGKFETTELHLYVLAEDSPMFMHLRSTWNNCILKSTLKFGTKKTSLTSISSRTSSKVDNSQLLQLFYQLKTEILQSHRMEQTFVLVNELFTAAQKSFNLKKYFWKSPDLFLYIVNQLQIYMPQSSRHSSKNRGNNREDELDFVVVLLDTLVCLFRETDALATRVNVVNVNKGQAIKDVLKTIMVQPLPCQSPEEANLSEAARKLLSGTDGCLFRVGRETESKKLLNETLDSATSLLYELMCVVHQANCFSTGPNILNICWLVKILESQEDTRMFVQRMMDRLTSIVSESDALLSSRDAVLLYRQLFVLKNFLEYSPVVGSQIRFGYAEEFRYYIRKPVVKNKLPSKYPLTSPTIELLDRVTNHVLNKNTQQSFR